MGDIQGQNNKNHPRLLNPSQEYQRDWYEVLRTLGENNFQPRLIYPAKLSSKIDGEIKMFQDKQKR